MSPNGRPPFSAFGRGHCFDLDPRRWFTAGEICPQLLVGVGYDDEVRSLLLGVTEQSRARSVVGEPPERLHAGRPKRLDLLRKMVATRCLEIVRVEPAPELFLLALGGPICWQRTLERSDIGGEIEQDDGRAGLAEFGGASPDFNMGVVG